MNCRTICAILILISPALTTARAADPLTAAILHNSTTVSYYYQGNSNNIFLDVRTWQNPNEARQADLMLFFYDWTTSAGRLLDAYGSIPPSMIKVTGQTVTVNIPDVRQLVGPDFYIRSELNVVGPIAIDCTFVSTPKLIIEETSKFTERDDEVGGKAIITKAFGKSITYTAAVTGQVAGYTLPQFEAPWNYGDTWLKVGDTKQHVTPY